MYTFVTKILNILANRKKTALLVSAVVIIGAAAGLNMTENQAIVDVIVNIASIALELTAE